MEIKVGILARPEIKVRFNGAYKRSDNENIYREEIDLIRKGQDFFIQADSTEEPVNLPVTFSPVDPATSFFELADVTIGIDFHWERKENQQFQGALSCIEESGQVRAINILDLEDYLRSVISSEMSATSSLELLKTHAVISRSWLLAQQNKAKAIRRDHAGYRSSIHKEDEYIRWFDREDHTNFDVCADDHCQRYQGIQKATTAAVREAIATTRGEVLYYNNTICDARFSKCCGGITESFENVWESQPHPYLKTIYDSAEQPGQCDIHRESDTARWVESRPDVFCNTTDASILSEVLNDYDRETTNFFRWEIFYRTEEISELIRQKLSIDFGTVTDLTPIERGASGRLIRLKITGTRKTLIIGKELLIRKALSPSHLYSSAFTVEKVTENGKADGFRLRGAGWGHGVGLCQIGAAVMSARGYNYREILQHYFPGTDILKAYE